MNKLTEKQKKVLEFITNFIQQYYYGPSYKDIASAFNFASDGTVRTYLEHLEKKGYIQRKGKARSITLIHNPFDIPVLGNIQAGEPIDRIENIENTLHDFASLNHSEHKFALKIKGNSMINAGILDGDIAIIEQNIPINQMDIVAISLENQATLKRYKKEKDSITLLPENPNFKPIIVPKNKTSIILGKCVGILRDY